MHAYASAAGAVLGASPVAIIIAFFALSAPAPDPFVTEARPTGIQVPLGFEWPGRGIRLVGYSMTPAAHLDNDSAPLEPGDEVELTWFWYAGESGPSFEPVVAGEFWG